MQFRNLTIGTRGSKLALWQANHIKDKLSAIGVQANLKIIKTQGDKIQHLRLDKLEGKGFFTKELEEELLSGGIDLAVHSHKDLPTIGPEGLTIAAVSERADPSELLIILPHAFDPTQRFSLKQNALVGTSSNRRKAQLQALRPDFQFKDLRGNVITRVDKLRQGNYDAIMLAKAGISRIEMDLSDLHVIEIAPTEIVPAPAQGVLALQIRESDQELHALLQKLHHSETAETIGVERKVLRIFEAGCHAPLGCYCHKVGDQYHVWTSKADTADELPDRLYLTDSRTEDMAAQIAEKFSKTRSFVKSVFLSRDLAAYPYFERSLKKHGIAIHAQSLINVAPLALSLESLGWNSAALKKVDWVFFTSKNSIKYFFGLNPQLSSETKFAVLGRGSESELRKFGHSAHFSGENWGIEMDDIARSFADSAQGQTVLIPRAQESLGTLQKFLEPKTTVIDIPVYETKAISQVPQLGSEVLVFTSPSNVNAYFSKHTLAEGQRVVAIGHASGRALQQYGIDFELPGTPDEIGLAEAVFGLDSQ